MIVSFIIPAYNAADTIIRCLESIYGLSLKLDEFEVIVIDDCSTDNTVEVIELYANNHTNLTLICQHENHRQGAARNRGVKVAKGEYICFVDADDAVTEGIVAAIKVAKKQQTDMTALHFAYANEQGTITKEAYRLSFEEGQLFSGIEMQNAHPYWCSAPWGYIYRRTFLYQVNYPFAEDVLYEDSDFVVVHLYNARRMAYLAECGYLTYYREGSTTHSISYRNLADYLFLGERMLKFYNDIDITSNHMFAEGILEGACFNVAKSCKRLIKLKNLKEVHEYYNRIDSYIDRKNIYSDPKIRLYYVNAWTLMCMKHPQLSMIILSILMPIYRFVKK